MVLTVMTSPVSMKRGTMILAPVSRVTSLRAEVEGGECESCVSFQEGRSYCIHELDAASNNGVDDIKALIEQVQVPPQVGKYSV